MTLRLNKHYKKYLIILTMLLPILLCGITYDTHKVKKGDSLYSISRKYGVSVAELMTLNDLKSDALQINQVLKIKPEKKKEKLLPASKITASKSPPGVSESTQPKPVIQQPETKPTNPAPLTTTKPITPSTTTESMLPAVNPAPVVSASLPDEYFYTIAPKDNLYQISLKYQVKLPDLLNWNGFEDAKVLIKPGQKIIIKDPALNKDKPLPVVPKESKPVVDNAPELKPSSNVQDSTIIEKVYIVQKKDTLFRIASMFGITVEELKKLNNLSSNDISVGQRLYIVSSKPVEEEDKQVQPLLTEDEIRSKTKIRNDLIMPVEGKVISEYGIRNGRPHKGIDLGAKSGSPIFAVLDGVVVYSGYQGSYGNVVVLEHPDFVMTVYGHNERNIVNVNDVVKKGQIIALVGSTGNATAPHVHFEYRLKAKPINPRKVLPLDY